MSKRIASNSVAAKAVARKGIVVGSSQGSRSVQVGSRLPESARKAAQASVRSALSKHSK